MCLGSVTSRMTSGTLLVETNNTENSYCNAKMFSGFKYDFIFLYFYLIYCDVN